MSKPVQERKKKYAPPRLRRYGDLRTLTLGNRKNKNEPTGVKTRTGGPG
ncbi:MAG TPA: lasso RiPP family leader peptide-containing protein [Candidatus Limnocylindria bacterium]|nr:lasso RiPP family leader peptide-containing protein [Candidatus Limnocylindria bacterium]